jgi:FKBP12-rapamycin complex-associated protein
MDYLADPTDDGRRGFERDCLGPLVARLGREEPGDRDLRDNAELFGSLARFVGDVRGQTAETRARVRDAAGLLFTRFEALVRQRTRAHLRHFAPELADWRFPAFPMFGARDVRIAGFEDEVRILGTKERPRVVRIRGSDGHAYAFLLKAHEDLRNDQRVMQLCGLLNGFLRSRITTFAIIPLTSTLGLIQWVPNTVALADLIQPQLVAATRNKQAGSLERTAFMDYFGAQVKSGAIHALGIHRLEALRTVTEKYAAHETALRDAMWNFAPDSEAWLACQANYSASLAVMSIVGYLIGLGDRHTRNIMLDRVGGRIVHIDFGELYDAARSRASHPEYVPFRLTRLTRLIVAALGPCGYDGVFRKCCEETMMTVRQNRETLLTVLQINWRSPTRPASFIAPPLWIQSGTGRRKRQKWSMA